jgi:uncharacterized membrane protein
MNTEAIAASHVPASEAESIRQMIEANSDKARQQMQKGINANIEAQRAIMREQIDTLRFQTDRAISNEMGSRTLNKLFGSFSLIQKIMQNMG